MSRTLPVLSGRVPSVEVDGCEEAVGVESTVVEVVLAALPWFDRTSLGAAMRMGSKRCKIEQFPLFQPSYHATSPH